MKRRRQLPTLGALRVFEAAAHHGSFKDAAAELAVAPTSVSHQVRSLEAQLGVRLFDRFNRRVVLTPAGVALAGSLTDALDTMDAAVALARADGGQVQEERLVVAGNPGLLDCWLRARLAGFRRRHPEITLELIPSDETAAMLGGRADIALHFCLAPPPPLANRLLCGTSNFPVCCPDLAAGMNAPADLAGQTFLHEHSPGWWGAWLAAAGVAPGEGWKRGPVFHSSALVIESAVAGDGVAMGDELIAGDHLLAGRLVKPFAMTLETRAALYLVWPGKRALTGSEEAFAAWLAAELETFRPVARTLARQEPYIAIA